MWSTSGAFAKVLTQPTGLGLDEPRVEPLQMAYFRALFAALVLIPLLRPADLRWRPAMLPMVLCFAVMNATFVSALALGTAANAIVLQYTAPVWMYLACVWLLREPADNRSLAACGIAVVGIVIIVAGGWNGEQFPAVRLGLISGLTYAAVMVFLRLLNDVSSVWLTFLNHCVAALALIPFVYHLPLPSGPQLAVLFVYGAVQMSLPYWLVARGVRSVSPQEAGTITLTEPVLNPLWTYLVAGEQPHGYEFLGGAFIVGALAWRYWPSRRGRPPLNS